MTLRGGQSSGSIRTWRRHFPLSSIDSVVDLMREILTSSGFHLPVELDTDDAATLNSTHTTELSETESRGRSTNNNLQDTCLLPCVIEPDLAFVSIVLGFVENHLTVTAFDESGHVPKSKSTTTLGMTNSRLSSRLRTPSTIGAKIPPSPLSVHTLEASDLVGTAAVSASPNPSTLEETCSLSSSSSISTPFANSCDGDVTARQANDSVATLRSRRSSNRRSRITPRRRGSSQSLHTTAESQQPVSSQAIHEPLHVITDHAAASSLLSSGKKRRFSDSTAVTQSGFPCLTFDEAEKRYQEFYTLVTTSPKLQPFIEKKSSEGKAPGQSRFATRSLIRAVCEVLRGSMSSGKGREKLTHTQSIYSFLTTGLLDSFGLAYTTVAACQLLGYSDVDLALSEEHGWVEFGPPDARQSADVATWMHNAHLGSSSTYESTVHSDTRSRSSPTVSEPSEGKPSPAQDQSAEFEEASNPPPIRVPPLAHSWLYVNGFPVVCRPRILAITAAVAALQPGACLPTVTQAPTSAPITSGTRSPMFQNACPDLVTPSGLARHISSSPAISMQLVTLKHRLLWLFYDAGCLNRYPLGLTNLADLEDAFPSMVNASHTDTRKPEDEHPAAVRDESRIVGFATPTRDGASASLETAPAALKLYNQAVAVTNRYYANQHVYPYTCLAGCFYRHGDHRGALHYWSKAAEVIGQYNHSSEDLEIYRELLEIATQLMPQMFRSAAEASRSCSEGSVEADPDGYLYQPTNILDDPQCLAHLLAFYDHLCLWEEGSPVPVLHVGWVDKLMVNLARFSKRARRLLELSVNENRPTKSEEPLHSPMSTHSTSKKSDETSVCSPSVPSKRSSRRTRNTYSYSSEPATTPVSSIVTSNPSPSFSTTSSQTLTVPTSSPPVERRTDILSPVVLSIPEDREERADKALDGSRRQKTKLVQPVDVQPMPVTKTTTVPEYELPECVPIKATDMTSLPSSEVAAVLAGIDQEPDQHKLDADIEEQDGSPSPPPLIDFPNNDDFLTSLVEACDQRLLNPAFLWGVEPHVPFLPADVAPEDAFSRLLASLETKQPPPQTTTASLFPTPPNSGSLCDSTLEGSTSIAGSKETVKTDVQPTYNATETKVHSEQAHSSPLHFEQVSGAIQSVDGFTPADDSDLLAREVPSDLLDTMTGLETEFKLEPLLQDSDGCDELLNSIMKTEADLGSTTSPPDHHSPRATRGGHAKTMEELIVRLTLHSTKMISIVELLRAQRLNSSAIKLALTAQSQVCLRRTGLSSLYEV